MNGTVDSRTFWADLFNSAEKDGESLRVGEYRSAPINAFWAVLKDGADYAAESFESEQLAVDWMVAAVYFKTLGDLETKHGIGWRDYLPAS
jgi:hypothetical protein